MVGKAAVLAAILAIGGWSASGAEAHAIPHLHILGQLRVDGVTDLHGHLRVRRGMKVTDGIITDNLTASGPVAIGGSLAVTGAASSNGLNAGGGAVTTTGALQGGSLAITGNSSVAGSLSVTSNASVGGGLQLSGDLQGSTASFSGGLAAGAISSPAISSDSGTFTRLNVPAGGTVNFSNASVQGLNLSTVGLNSLSISNGQAGGPGGRQALTISQAGQTASLSVAQGNLLTVAGGGLGTPSLDVLNNAQIGGQLTVGKLYNPTDLLLLGPTVSTAGNLAVGAGGNFVLEGNGNNQTHIISDHDTSGQCSAPAATTGTTLSCSVTFSKAYASAPNIVASPAGNDPTFITGYSVQSGTAAFTIYFRVSHTGTAVFDWMAQQ
ncbi:MAG: hypothetical protein ACRDFS_00925 [Chloroflexota bacterium]